MCLLVMASRLVESAPLVVGANRDERLERPAQAITVLRGARPRVLGGRDREAGGTWLAVNEHGVVAALTNRPSSAGRDPSKRSRGELPLLLARHPSAAGAVDEFVGRVRPADYNPSWLLVGDRAALYSLDMTGGARPVADELPPGLHILENLPLGAASVKVDHVRGLLGPAAGGEDRESLSARLRHVLADHTLPPGAGRHPCAPDTVERPVETLAACVHTDTYGTRSSTVVVVPADSGIPVSITVADGHPCEVPFTDATGLWQAPGPV